MSAFNTAKAGIQSRTVVVVWQDDGEFKQAKVSVSGAVGKYLDKAWAATLAEIKNRDTVAYSPDLAVRSGDGYVVRVDDDLRPDSEVIQMLVDKTARPKIKPNRLEAESLYCYAVISTTAAGRVVMIKKGNPSKRAHGKQWVLRGDELSALDDDPWQLHPQFDLAVSKTGGWILNYWAFEQLMKDSDRLLENVDKWVAAVAKSLPMTKANSDVLAERCRESTRLMRRLRAINARGHLKRVTVAGLKTHLRAEGLTVGDYVKGNRLVVTENNVAPLLEVLNEDLYSGGLTNDKFVSDGKRPRR